MIFEPKKRSWREGKIFLERVRRPSGSFSTIICHFK